MVFGGVLLTLLCSILFFVVIGSAVGVMLSWGEQEQIKTRREKQVLCHSEVLEKRAAENKKEIKTPDDRCPETHPLNAAARCKLTQYHLGACEDGRGSEWIGQLILTYVPPTQEELEQANEKAREALVVVGVGEPTPASMEALKEAIEQRDHLQETLDRERHRNDVLRKELKEKSLQLLSVREKRELVAQHDDGGAAELQLQQQTRLPDGRVVNHYVQVTLPAVTRAECRCCKLVTWGGETVQRYKCRGCESTGY